MNGEFSSTPAEDLLDGAKDYEEFTGFPRRRCYYLLETGQLPGGKMGSRWIGSKTVVREYLARLTSTEAA